MRSTITIALTLSLFLTACDSSKKEVDADTAETKGVIPQHQLDALEKAKQVEQVMKDADEKRKDTVE